MTEKDTLQLVNDSDSESEKIHQLLRSIGHDDGIEQILGTLLLYWTDPRYNPLILNKF